MVIEDLMKMDNDAGDNAGDNTEGTDGESLCENHGYDKPTCGTIGCCQFDEGQCWSAVGAGICMENNKDDNA